MLKSFGNFVDKKKRDGLNQLRIIEKLLRKEGMKVESFLEQERDPYLFCENPKKDLNFEGVRIYKIGSSIAFRIQKESKTHPYGRAYPIPIEDMFNDFMTDEGVDEQRAGTMVIEAVGKELRRFFDMSLEADKENREAQSEDRASSSAVGAKASVSVVDYGNLITAKS
jgi:hypothetical protein